MLGCWGAGAGAVLGAAALQTQVRMAGQPQTSADRAPAALPRAGVRRS